MATQKYKAGSVRNFPAKIAVKAAHKNFVVSAGLDDIGMTYHEKLSLSEVAELLEWPVSALLHDLHASGPIPDEMYKRFNVSNISLRWIAENYWRVCNCAEYPDTLGLLDWVTIERIPPATAPARA